VDLNIAFREAQRQLLLLIKEGEMFFKSFVAYHDKPRYRIRLQRIREDHQCHQAEEVHVLLAHQGYA
jgi:hypothetical protein